MREGIIITAFIAGHCGKFKFLGGTGSILLRIYFLKVGPLDIPGVTTVKMTALF